MSLKKIKLSFFSGSRSEFDIISNILNRVLKNNDFEANLIVSGTHLKNNKPSKAIIIHNINLFKTNNTNETYYPRVISDVVVKITKKLKFLKPDFFILHGDRFESFAAAIASSSMNIPTIQLEAGDITNGGTYDDSARHAISRLSHLLFTTNEESKKRLIKYGEEKWRIKNFGSTTFEKLKKNNFATTEEIKNKFQLKLNKPIILFTFHSSSINYKKSFKDIKICVESLIKFSEQADIIITYPNDDLGSYQIIKEYKKLNKNNKIKIYKNLGQYFYHGIMALNYFNVQKVICVGNSSSGIKETPFFRCKTLNIGDRQKGRLQAGNVINVPIVKKYIVNDLRKILKDKFKKNEKIFFKNPYYCKDSSKKIINFIKQNRNKKFKLLNKQYN